NGDAWRTAGGNRRDRSAGAWRIAGGGGEQRATCANPRHQFLRRCGRHRFGSSANRSGFGEPTERSEPVGFERDEGWLLRTADGVQPFRRQRLWIPRLI